MSKFGREDIVQAVENKELIKLYSIMQEQKELVNDNLLHIAIKRHGDVDICKALIEGGMNVNYKSVEGYTALHYAVLKSGYGNSPTALMELLIENGADVKLMDNINLPAIAYAIIQNQSDSCKLILDAGFDPNYVIDLNWKNYNNNNEVHQEFFHYGKSSLLSLICSKDLVNDVEILKCFIEKGVKINQEKYDSFETSFLFEAAQNCKKDFVKLLLENKANPNFVMKCSGQSVLNAVCSNNVKYTNQQDVLEIVKLLFSYNITKEVINQTNNFQENAVNLAFKSGLSEVGKFLQIKNIDINAVESKLPNNYTPLQVQCSYGYFNEIKILLENGANPNIECSIEFEVNFVRVKDFRTALDCAKVNKNLNKQDVKFIETYSLVHKIFSGVKLAEQDYLNLNVELFVSIDFDKIATQYINHEKIVCIKEFKENVLIALSEIALRETPNSGLQDRVKEVKNSFIKLVEIKSKELKEYEELFENLKEKLKSDLIINDVDHSIHDQNFLTNNSENITRTKLLLSEKDNQDNQTNCSGENESDSEN